MQTQAYFQAIQEGDAETLATLLARQPGLVHARAAPGDAPEGQESCTGLHAAVSANRPDIVRMLVEAGAELDARNAFGRTALHDAIELGAEETQDLLLGRGAEVDICAAAILGCRARLRELLEADPALANDRSTQLSPLGWAAFGNQVETAADLLAHGARMDDGELLCAASVGHVEVGRLLMEHGARPDEVVPHCGVNAVHEAVRMRYTDDARPFLRMLLEAGANVHLRTADGRTALELAEEGARRQEERLASRADPCRKAYAEVIALLRAAGAGDPASRPPPRCPPPDSPEGSP